MATKDNFGRKPQNFKGTKDFDGVDAKKRQYVIDQIRDAYERFGFEPLETPAIELMRTLDDKYGEEGQKNIFRLSQSAGESAAALRYDHTVTLARFMAMNPSKKVLPYRRYAIGPVWRNESVQAGRMRQFTQCDFDTVGSDSLVVDAEILAINYQVLSNLGFPENSFQLQFNDRRLLNVMTRVIGCSPSASIEILRAWDKLEKVGLESTVNELKEKCNKKAEGSDFWINIENYQEFTKELISADDYFAFLSEALGVNGEKELQTINNLYQYALSMGVPEKNLFFNPLLARGLDYYTGPIFETIITESGIGSISGGGRFDNLVESLGGPNLPASGSSFGLDRVLFVMDQLGIKIPVENAAPVFITLFDKSDLELVKYTFNVASKLRLDGIAVEVYTGNQDSLGKQINTAERKGSQIVLVIGPEEMAKNKIKIKLLKTREQHTVPLSFLKEKVSRLLS